LIMATSARRRPGRLRTALVETLRKDFDRGELSESELKSGVAIGAISETKAQQVADRARLIEETGEGDLKQETVEQALKDEAITREEAEPLILLAKKNSERLAREQEAKKRKAAEEEQEQEAEKAPKFENMAGYPFSKKELLDGVSVGALDAKKGLSIFEQEEGAKKVPTDGKKFTNEQLLSLVSQGTITGAEAQQLHDKEALPN